MRLLLLFLVSILSSANAYSQGKVALYAGISQVLNAKAIKETDYTDEKFPPGSAFGISYLRNSTKQISFFARAGFIKKGFLRQTASPDNSYYTKISINYLYFTPQVSFKFSGIKNSNIFLIAGPYIASSLSGKETGVWISFAGPRTYNTRIVFRNSKENNTGQVQVSNFDFGVNSSLIYQRNRFGIMLNWQGGLKTINTYIPFSEFNKKYRNNTIELCLFYQVDLVKHKVKKSSIKCAPIQ